MHSVTPTSCWCPSKSDTDRNKLWLFYFSCRAVMPQRTSYTSVKSPDTALGKWALHSRWVKRDLKKLNRSGLPGNTGSCSDKHPQPLSPSSLLQLQQVCCSHHGNIILGDRSGTGASDMGSATVPPCHAGERDVKPSTLLLAVGIKARAMPTENKSSQNYHPARNAENPTELCVTLQTHHYLMP